MGNNEGLFKKKLEEIKNESLSRRNSLSPFFLSYKSDIRQARHRMQAYAVWLLKDPEKQGVVKGGQKG